jgi:hypothetical protein
MELDSLKSVVKDVRTMLANNDEWVDRFAGYAEKIKQNQDKIVEFKKSFNEWKPLYFYMPVISAKDHPHEFILRYQGQEVATLNAKYDPPLLSTKVKHVNGNKRFGVRITLEDAEWTSEEAKWFRDAFRQHSERAVVAAKSHEHALESIFLGELEKQKKEDKDTLLCGVRPVKLAGIARFQMCTPLTASKSQIDYAGVDGGGIDVLARVTRGSSTQLCVMELKKDYGSPRQAMKQALAYGVFLQELLASKSGNDWLEIFGFSGNWKKLPETNWKKLCETKWKKLRETIKVCVVMPIGENAPCPCQPMRIETDLGSLEMHYIYLNVDWREHLKEKKILIVKKSTLDQSIADDNTLILKSFL